MFHQRQPNFGVELFQYQTSLNGWGGGGGGISVNYAMFSSQILPSH